MGCQGEIYVIYGLKTTAKCEWEAGSERNPVVYSINGHTLCDDEDLIEYLADPDDEPFEDSEGRPIPAGCPKIEFWSGIPTSGYGAADMDKAKLCMTVLGHSGEYGSGDMGARHFAEGFGSKVGSSGEALIGFVVCNESYITHAQACPPVDEISATGPRLLHEIQEKLGLTAALTDLRLYLYFDSLNGL